MTGAFASPKGKGNMTGSGSGWKIIIIADDSEAEPSHSMRKASKARIAIVTITTSIGQQAFFDSRTSATARRESTLFHYIRALALYLAADRENFQSERSRCPSDKTSPIIIKEVRGHLRYLPLETQPQAGSQHLLI